jgi:hypothetical protein
MPLQKYWCECNLSLVFKSVYYLQCTESTALLAAIGWPLLRVLNECTATSRFTRLLHVRFGILRQNNDSFIYIFFSLALQFPWALASAFSFMIILLTVGLLGRVISSSQSLYLSTQNKYIHIPNIHALCGIWSHDPDFRASEDSSCPRPLGYCDRLHYIYADVFWRITLF